MVHSPKPKLVHYIFLFIFIVQFPWSAAFDSKDVPSGTMWHRAFGRFDEGCVSMQTGTVTPTFGPRCLVVNVEVPKAHTQRGDYFGEPGG